MVNGLWGKKIGMTQVFSEKDKVVPVTVIDVARWLVTNVKTQERDGYNAVQIGLVKEKFAQQAFEGDWLKKLSTYFLFVREVRITEGDSTQFVMGQPADFASILKAGDFVDVFGKTIGRGFQGVVKRHNFAGGPASHGGKFGRIPGSLSFMRSRGRVIKGKRMPGQYGNEQKALKKLEIIRIESESNLVLVKGSVPGRAGSLVFMRKV
jgi:large subunit ribosomal protein L3